jgi:hypothetical protein
MPSGNWQPALRLSILLLDWLTSDNVLLVSMN